MVIAYCIVSSLTFSIILSAFLRDKDADRGVEAWMFISLATLLCPITLPFILSSKLRAYQDRARKSKHMEISSRSVCPSKEALL